MDPIRHEISLKAAPADVYAAVVQPDGLKGWWSTHSDIETTVGKTNELRFDKQGTPVVMRFRLDTLDENQKVVWACTENDNPVWVGSTLRWELEPDGAGTKLLFVHEGFAAGGPPYEMTVEGWKMFVGSLQAYVETGRGQPMD